VTLRRQIIAGANQIPVDKRLSPRAVKGGIDPAGADERWKTARTALTRIHEAFDKHRLRPGLFFIGAAIESKMAGEIWEMLRGGLLLNAANLTDDEQISSLTRWLCSL
jgi:hypothetical protein